MSLFFNDEERTTDFAAMGVSLLLAFELTNYNLITTVNKGGGFDFYLYDTSSIDPLTSFPTDVARLEISGIAIQSKHTKYYA